MQTATTIPTRTPAQDAYRAMVMRNLNDAFAAIKKSVVLERLEYLYMRWLDEREYEDFADYEKVMQTLMPKEFTFISMTKRPFGIKFKWADARGEYIYHLTTTTTKTSMSLAGRA